MPSSANHLTVALLQQANEQSVHLREALQELGAAVVYEAPPAEIDRDKLEGSGASVVIVNLDADSDSYIDELYDVLDAGDYEVVFNDAQVSSNLQGWDHARWARNLASKLLHKPEIAEPPRPPGAEAVPAPAATPTPKTPTPAAAPPVQQAPAPVAKPVAAHQAPAAPTWDMPTVEMPAPQPPHREPAPAAGLDIGELTAFAELTQAPAEPEPTPVAPARAEPLVAPPSDFGAELDALFAAAEAKQPEQPAAKAHDTSAADIGGGFDFDLPAEFNLEDVPDNTVGKAATGLSDLDLPFGDLAADEPPAPPAPPPAAKATPPAPKLPPMEKAGPGGFDEFPAIFDLAAADVPEATDKTFKPAALPEKPAPSSSSFPSDWGLEDLGGDAGTGAPGKFERMSASDFLAPDVEESSAEAQRETLPTGGGLGGLELMPMEEAIAPQNQAQQAAASPAAPLKVGTGAGVSRVFVLGASIGGPEAVRDFLSALPVRFPVLFVLAQHMGEEFLELMASQLAKAIKLTVRKPTHGERVSHGEVLIVPTTHRLQVDGEGVVTLAHLREKSQYSPSIDQVLHDVADQFGPMAGAIVFSGMAHDAIEGSEYMKSRGGTIWVQDPDTCVVSSMVDGARAAGVVDFTGSPQQLAAKMIADYGKA
jgi:two-component system chemotaxis response regulator CheB/chemosensory pili system protein ChpB (putative protein-glutamate methylesterase)